MGGIHRYLSCKQIKLVGIARCVLEERIDLGYASCQTTSFSPDRTLSRLPFKRIEAMSILYMASCQVYEHGVVALLRLGGHSAGAMAGESMEKSYKLRFRHLSGDVGPLTFQENSTVLAMKSQIWDEWPTEEPLSSQVISDPLLCAMDQFRRLGMHRDE